MVYEMERVACFGEIMLHLSPKGYMRFHQSGSFVAVYSGAEANVWASLAQSGLKTGFIVTPGFAFMEDTAKYDSNGNLKRFISKMKSQDLLFSWCNKTC